MICSFSSSFFFIVGHINFALNSFFWASCLNSSLFYVLQLIVVIWNLTHFIISMISPLLPLFIMFQFSLKFSWQHFPHLPFLCAFNLTMTGFTITLSHLPYIPMNSLIIFFRNEHSTYKLGCYLRNMGLNTSLTDRPDTY